MSEHFKSTCCLQTEYQLMSIVKNFGKFSIQWRHLKEKDFNSKQIHVIMGYYKVHHSIKLLFNLDS